MGVPVVLASAVACRSALASISPSLPAEMAVLRMPTATVPDAAVASPPVLRAKAERTPSAIPEMAVLAPAIRERKSPPAVVPSIPVRLETALLAVALRVKSRSREPLKA